MKCVKCGKNFDEVTYNRICPKCGTFNRNNEDYDVNQFFNFGEQHQANINNERSYSSQSAAQTEHEKLHRMYENASTRTAHEKTQSQRTIFDVPETAKRERKKAPVAVIIILLVVVVIAGIIGFGLVESNLANSAMSTLEYTNTTVETGQAFDIEGRTVTVDSAAVVDTSMIAGLPVDEKLVAVHLTVNFDDYDWDNKTEAPYLKAGDVCKENIDSYDLDTILPTIGFQSDEILSGYSYLTSENSGYFLYFAGNEETQGELVFDVMAEKYNVSVLQEKIHVPVTFQEAE